MTKPPCYTDGHDCPRRCVGCRENCTDWHKWLAIHEAEKDAIRREKDKRDDVECFMTGSTKRKARAYAREYAREKRRDNRG